MLVKYALVILGGGIGAAVRYGVSLLANRLLGAGFPAGTLIVNLSGCFLIGLSFALAEQKLISPNVRLFFATGFLGGLTTFSTYALESINAGRDGLHAMALTNIAVSNAAGLALVVAGIWAGRLL